MKFQRFLSIPILMVFLLIGVVCYITVFIFIDDWVGLKSSAGSLNALVFISLASLCLFSFFCCVLTNPGHVPASYVPDVEDSAVSDQESKKNGRCDKCSTYKPPRAHHCRVCRRCVLRMDHHCLWINNCVGYWNYKAFFMLVLYATLGCLYSTVIIIKCASQKDLEFSGSVSHKVFYVVSGLVMASLSLMLGTLLGWHFYLITHNMTTIEYYEGIRAAWLAKKSGQGYRHPYNLSIYTNITSVSIYLSHSFCAPCVCVFCIFIYMLLKSVRKVNIASHFSFDQVLGPNVLKWLCPTSVGHLKDGLIFPTPRDSS